VDKLDGGLELVGRLVELLVAHQVFAEAVMHESILVADVVDGLRERASAGCKKDRQSEGEKRTSSHGSIDFWPTAGGARRASPCPTAAPISSRRRSISLA